MAYKVPGNLLGLARLQACVANETGLGIGGLVVHSTYAFLNGPKTRIRRLLKDLRQADVSYGGLKMSWFTDYRKAAERTDRLTGRPDHVALLAAGLFGECGSVLAELKKVERETDAYPRGSEHAHRRNRGCPLVFRTSCRDLLDPSEAGRVQCFRRLQDCA